MTKLEMTNSRAVAQISDAPPLAPREVRFSRMETVWLAALAGSSCVFLQLVVDPRILFQSLMPLFYFGSTFVEEAACAPGGLLAYAARFVQQYHIFGWTGSVVMTLLLALTWLLSRQLVHGPSKADGDSPIQATVLQTLPPCLLLILATTYNFPWMETALQLIAAMAAALVFARFQKVGATGRLIIFFVLSLAMNHLAGIVSAALFTCLVGLPELLRPTRRASGAVLLVSGAALGVCFFYGFHIKPSTLLPAAAVPRNICLALYVSLALIATLPCLPKRVKGIPTPADAKGARQREAARKAGTPANWALRAAIVAWTLLALSLCSAYSLVDKTLKANVAVEFHASRQQWDEVIAAARQLKTHSWAVRLETTRALYYKGELLDDLLNFPIVKGDGLFPINYAGSMKSPEALAQTLFELGQVNLAEHWATEAFEMSGMRPSLLRLLAKINILKGRPQAAVPFLSFLRRNPVYYAWADDCIQRLEKDPTLHDDPEIARIRSFQITADTSVIAPPTTAAYLQQLLHSNAGNRMAFEYLMAEYLVTGKPQPILQNLKEFAGRRELPRHIAEVVADDELERGSIAPQAAQFICDDARRRLNAFRVAVSPYQSNLESGRTGMAHDFGNTYWYFILYNATGRTAPQSH